MTSRERAITDLVKSRFPSVQGIYLFGSWGTEDEWPESDVDIALLLPPEEAGRIGTLYLTELHGQLEEQAKKSVDLINLREVDTVLQKEVVSADRRIYCADEQAVDEFEMLTISYYQKLNEERAEIIEEGLRSGRFYQP